MSFDITSVLRNVSEPDTGKEQISYLPLDLLDPDDNNFYSLDGIPELADSIATVGLQQPIRVRPNKTEPGRYTIVSGHRRRAACLLLQDSEDEKEKHLFDDGVACIVEKDEVSPALRELRLIYANSATRTMTAADLSKQAERVEALLYQLQEEGMEFPGRMRDHVARAVNASRTKLARLHAIRKNLQPEILERFDRGELNESVAYRISQEPRGVQKELEKRAGPALKGLELPTVDAALRQIKNAQKTAPAAAAEPYSAEAYLKERDAEDGAFFEMLREEADEFLKTLGGVYDRQDGIQRLKDEFGLIHRGWLYDRVDVNCSPKGVRIWDTDGHPDNDITRTWTETYDMLCTIALGRAALALKKASGNNPSPSAPGLQWQTGKPSECGTYETRVGVGEEDSIKAGSWQRLEWNGEDWQFANGAELPKGVKVFRWVKLPEV